MLFPYPCCPALSTLPHAPSLPSFPSLQPLTRQAISFSPMPCPLPPSPCDLSALPHTPSPPSPVPYPLHPLCLPLQALARLATHFARVGVRVCSDEWVMAEHVAAMHRAHAEKMYRPALSRLHIVQNCGAANPKVPSPATRFLPLNPSTPLSGSPLPLPLPPRPALSRLHIVQNCGAANPKDPFFHAARDLCAPSPSNPPSSSP
ncbi:unnamed protein product [Closterium sp. Naga37s-1]|nr:unnamed protein product [Closterium sp. Naga37s-1]